MQLYSIDIIEKIHATISQYVNPEMTVRIAQLEITETELVCAVQPRNYGREFVIKCDYAGNDNTELPFRHPTFDRAITVRDLREKRVGDLLLMPLDLQVFGLENAVLDDNELNSNAFVGCKLTDGSYRLFSLQEIKQNLVNGTSDFRTCPWGAFKKVC